MPTPGYTQGEFEVEFPSQYLAGTIEAGVNEVGETPSHNIDINDAWEIHVNWQLTGQALGMVNGLWYVSAFMESIGGGSEFALPDPVPNAIPLNPTNGQYSTLFSIPANAVTPTPPKTDIVYKLVVTVVYKDAAMKWGPIAGFVELPMLHFYEDLQ
ncbi:MAG: hypothetical protein P4L50_29670 [Anaerolineaceae bacterium]|nr:hypothetical protein [Anaerolineaceae bacterium]